MNYWGGGGGGGGGGAKGMLPTLSNYWGAWPPCPPSSYAVSDLGLHCVLMSFVLRHQT